MKTYVIGLTGGMGSGKTTVAELFAKHGIPIIDADVIARKVTQPGQPAFHDIIHHFKQSLLLDNGNLDRRKLSEIVFKQEDERIWLEKLLHPLIREEMIQEINKLTSDYCIVVIPLLMESKLPFNYIDRILLIDAPKSIQLQRIKLRDNRSHDQIEAILTTQLSREERLAKADDVITNDGVISDLALQVDRLHQTYLDLSKAKKGT